MSLGETTSTPVRLRCLPHVAASNRIAADAPTTLPIRLRTVLLIGLAAILMVGLRARRGSPAVA